MALLVLSLGQLFYVLLLLINSLAILNEERFLARIGWASVAQEPSTYGPAGVPNNALSIKAKFINLVSAIRTLLRIPLIVVNIVVILYELVLG